MQVDFMIIGAQKCGTTTLFDILDRHPSIVGCRPKEPHFFSKTPDWKTHLASYERLFEQRHGALYGEASTTYTFYPMLNLRIWDDIYAYNPRMKLIYVVRAPIDRIVSGYMHAYERGFTDRSIEDAIVNEPAFIDITRYYTQISPYIKTFGRSNVLLLDFDDLIHDRSSVLRQVAEFLGIEFGKFTAYETLHANASLSGRKRHHKFDKSLTLKALRKVMPPIWKIVTDNSKRHFREKPVLSLECRRLILHMLDLEVRELQRLMVKDLGHWMSLDEQPSSRIGGPQFRDGAARSSR